MSEQEEEMEERERGKGSVGEGEGVRESKWERGGGERECGRGRVNILMQVH